jgi:FeS assembly SUF system regulator
MLKISRLADYSVLIMQQLDKADGSNLSATDLAGRTQLSPATVSKLLKQLHEARLVVSHRGVLGGYQLQRSAEQISLLDVVAAIDGPLALTDCSLEAGDCIHQASCSASGNWQLISGLLSRVLTTVNLRQMSAAMTADGLLAQLQLDNVSLREAL